VKGDIRIRYNDVVVCFGSWSMQIDKGGVDDDKTPQLGISMSDFWNSPKLRCLGFERKSFGLAPSYLELECPGFLNLNWIGAYPFQGS